MKIGNTNFRTIWVENNFDVKIIDQNFLPFSFVIKTLCTGDDAYIAIADMAVRGAPLIGVTAAYGVYLYAKSFLGANDFMEKLSVAVAHLQEARPTAVNLKWAVERQIKLFDNTKPQEFLVRELLANANKIAEEDIETNRAIGSIGLDLIEKIYDDKGIVNILTHCNAGWLATVDYGTATAPIYMAKEQGFDVNVWVDETRPRNQGSRLTAYELLNEDISHSVIADNTGGHLMQTGKVDMVIVGCDRVAANGDVCNKIGTYLKALAAFDNNIPFYVAAPTSTIDLNIKSGKDIPIEERHEDEVKYVAGFCGNKNVEILVSPKDSPATNYGFDITPARLITGLITEKGIIRPKEASISRIMGK